MKLTPEQVEKLEAAAEKVNAAYKAEHKATTNRAGYQQVTDDAVEALSDACDADTILTLCREWREMLEVIDALHNGADHKEYKGVHEDEWSDRASRICQRSRP